MELIKPIETLYNGYRFRSRLEARWAVFFDTLGVKYEYEPEGYVLPDGTYYLPDFLIHDVITRHAKSEIDYTNDIFVEVKGIPNASDAKKIMEFSLIYPIWVVGALPDPNDYTISCTNQRKDYCNKKYDFDHQCVFCPYNYGTIDGDSCFEFSLAFDDGHLSFHGADSNYGFGHYSKEIEIALRAARQARFEHGETPVIHGRRYR